MPKPRHVDAVQERDLAIDCTNEVWTLLGRDDRSPEADAEDAAILSGDLAAGPWYGLE